MRRRGSCLWIDDERTGCLKRSGKYARLTTNGDKLGGSADIGIEG
jgi:hypothetical protein